MKVKVKATGEFVEVTSKIITSPTTGKSSLKYIDSKTGISYFKGELFFPKDVADDPDYWTRLEHTYAGMAMQGLCANSEWDDSTWEVMAEDAIDAAHVLVEKLKEKEERK